MKFAKTTPGFACKVAEKADADWVCPKENASWEQAADAYGNIVAYHDADGWFVLACLANEDVTGIAA